ncbi:MAG: rplY [Ignavibacteria bacterium]|nr:rplY [Ignavibacteria bacterium]
MSELILKVQKRSSGKQISRRLRREGKVPGVFYFKGELSVPILSSPKALKPIIYTKHSKVVHLEIEGETVVHNCILKDASFDPVSEAIMHFDLMGIEPNKKFTMEFPISLKGQAIGARLGGIVLHNLRKVAITCLPKDLPETIEIDITDLHVGKSIHLRDLSFPGVEFDKSLDSVVVSVVVPRTAKDKTPGEAGAPAAATAAPPPPEAKVTTKK